MDTAGWGETTKNIALSPFFWTMEKSLDLPLSFPYTF
jgi:hypothetical protein